LLPVQAGPDGGRIARFFGDGKKNLRAWVKLVSAEDRTVELTIATLEKVAHALFTALPHSQQSAG
jgi:hypothetical protein